MAKRNRYKTARQDFMASYREEPGSKCWIWLPKIFRFRIGYITVNPRRAAVFMSGKAIPVGRQVIPGCGNPSCINPAHTRMRHNGASLPPETPFLLEMEDFRFGPSYLRHKYMRKSDDIRAARKETLKVIVAIRNTKESEEELAERLHVGTSFVREARKLSLREFEDMKVDMNDSGVDPEDESNVPSDGYLFTLDGVA